MACAECPNNFACSYKSCETADSFVCIVTHNGTPTDDIKKWLSHHFSGGIRSCCFDGTPFRNCLSRRDNTSFVVDLRGTDISITNFSQFLSELKKLDKITVLTDYDCSNPYKFSLPNGTTVCGCKLESDCIEVPTFPAPGAAHNDEQGSPITKKMQLGVSDRIRKVDRLISKVSMFKGVAVLICGETGVGKEIIAQKLHAAWCPQSPFFAVNCSAIPESLFEAELFGYERGAFTGATEKSMGLFEEVRDGTIFLDEIGDMPINLQPKLLRVLQERCVTRIGSHKSTEVHFHLVCATNRPISELLSEGRFREDLYYRINGLTVTVPPLRDRPIDILWLTEKFLAEIASQHKMSCKQLSESAKDWIVQYKWPGNVRELRAVLECAYIVVDSNLITDKYFEETASTFGSISTTRSSLAEEYNFSMENLIRSRLEQMEWQIEATANSLSISRKTLWKRMKQYGISKPNKVTSTAVSQN